MCCEAELRGSVERMEERMLAQVTTSKVRALAAESTRFPWQ